MYATVSIDRVVKSAKSAIGLGQCGYRKDMKPSVKFFVVRQISEKMKGMKNMAYLAFIDLEKV